MLTDKNIEISEANINENPTILDSNKIDYQNINIPGGSDENATNSQANRNNQPNSFKKMVKTRLKP